MEPTANPPLLGEGAERAPIVETRPETFVQDVVEPSKQGPIFVYFWTPNPACEQFTPLVERLTREAGGQIRLVKINVQTYPEVVQQLQLQTVPAMLVFQNGAPVNGFMGPIPEDGLRQFFSRILGAPIANQAAEKLAAARAALDAGDIGTAQANYSDVLGEDPENAEAIAGIIESFLAADDRATAEAYLADVPEKLATHPAIATMRARLELADAETPDMAPLMEKLAANPKDHAARYDLAMAQFGGGSREAAIESLLEIIRQDRKWNDEAARKQLLKFFEALGPEDPLTLTGRRQLSSILFS